MNMQQQTYLHTGDRTFVIFYYNHQFVLLKRRNQVWLEFYSVEKAIFHATIILTPFL